jgi:hypothetical protein
MCDDMWCWGNSLKLKVRKYAAWCSLGCRTAHTQAPRVLSCRTSRFTPVESSQCHLMSLSRNWSNGCAKQTYFVRQANGSQSNQLMSTFVYVPRITAVHHGIDMLWQHRNQYNTQEALMPSIIEILNIQQSFKCVNRAYQQIRSKHYIHTQ